MSNSGERMIHSLAWTSHSRKWPSRSHAALLCHASAGVLQIAECLRDAHHAAWRRKKVRPGRTLRGCRGGHQQGPEPFFGHGGSRRVCKQINQVAIHRDKEGVGKCLDRHQSEVWVIARGVPDLRIRAIHVPQFAAIASSAQSRFNSIRVQHSAARAVEFSPCQLLPPAKPNVFVAPINEIGLTYVGLVQRHPQIRHRVYSRVDQDNGRAETVVLQANANAALDSVMHRIR